MRAKQAAKRLLPRPIVKTVRTARQKRAWRQESLAGQRHVMKTLASSRLMDRFRDGAPLPSGYGVNRSERCVEYPWALTRLSNKPGLVLDAGSTFNYPYILDYPALRSKTLHIMTLAPESDCYWSRGISYIYGDLRDAPMRAGLYETIMCVSVLEHIGCDNKNYTRDSRYRENAPKDYCAVMGEFSRLLKPGGTLLLTVPFGEYTHLGWLQQFDRALLTSAITAFGPAHTVQETFYRHTTGGWGLATAEECAHSRYGEGSPAASAVACVRMLKEELVSESLP